MLMVLVGGLIGGVLRGLAGIAKELVTKKNPVINWSWFLLSLGVSSVVGMFSGLAIQITLNLSGGEDFLFAILAGYAGADFIESLYTMKLKNRFKVDLEEKLKKV